MCYANVEIDWFGGILRTLGDIGNFEGIRDLSSAGRDESFVMRWTCLSIMGVRRAILNDNVLKEHARSAVASFGGDAHSDHVDGTAEKNAREIDEVLEHSWERASLVHWARTRRVDIIHEEYMG
ncbi:hypothetical protein BGY98DRAFT_649116 [Russula aff. rugulosa BPL654]|nr:hypothetical protein BGY98DRAFT_649116 [Russula aff. rugulosa BPL654]